ncbi:hypothetical protein ACS0TY_016980 [Phlomoides rotata]
MSGARLCGLLAELGYEGHGSLDSDSFEWPFQYDDVRPILDWLCSSLRPSNVLSPSELSQYEQFLQEGKLLEGEDLDFAYESISAFSARRDNQEAVFGTEEGLKEIRDATLAAKAEALELQKQLRNLQFQNDMLTGQASSLIQGRRARVAATSNANGQLTSIDDSLSARNLKMNAVLGRMASTAQELAHYHSGDEDGIYLAYADFHSYLLIDAACMKELNQWFSKQLDTGPYRLVAEEGKSKCSWVSLNEISNVLVRDSENAQHKRLSELQRLRSIFGTSERQWVEAQVENAKQQALLMTLKTQVTSDEAHIHLDLHSLRRKHAELAGELSTLYRKEEKLSSETIPDLCWELAQLQDTYILQGDYDLKVMRQEFYINRQKAFINHLISQLSRHQFLKLACQLEKKTMFGAYSLLKVIELELQGYLLASEGRVVWIFFFTNGIGGPFLFSTFVSLLCKNLLLLFIQSVCVLFPPRVVVCHWFKQPLMYLNKEQSMIVTLFSMVLEIFSVSIQMLRLVYQRMYLFLALFNNCLTFNQSSGLCNLTSNMPFPRTETDALMNCAHLFKVYSNYYLHLLQLHSPY